MYKLILFGFSLFFTQVMPIFSPKPKYYPTTGNTGEAVFVTPFIENGQIEEGRNKSYVHPLKGNVISYAGYFTVKDKDYKSNMFFWFFPSESGQSAPVVLWLQGGPGASSLYGLFEENGPFYVRPKHGLKLRKYSWTKTLNVLYIDNPVGTGFSFTTSDKGYSRDENDVSENLLIAVTQFFALFPYLQKNDFYVTGESYAGKYVPALANAIDKSNTMMNKRNGLKINLQGIAIGNGLCDPENMMVYGDYLYQIGLIDSNGRNEFQTAEKSVIDLIQKKRYELAFQKFDTLLNGDLTPYKTLFYNLTGFTYYFNYRFSDEDSTKGDYSKYLQSDLARRSIHVGNYPYNNGTIVEKFLMKDVMQSAKPLIEALLKKKYRILIYNGQLDIIVAYPLTVNFIKSLNWSGKDKYNQAQRHIFRVENRHAGYYKQVETLTEVLVRDAGHMVPKDQPHWALELITRFTYKKPL